VGKGKVVMEQQAAKRLLSALDAPDELSCATARDLILVLVGAEYTGIDVDSDLQFAALLRHLDDCKECIELYASFTEDLELLMGEECLPLVSHLDSGSGTTGTEDTSRKIDIMGNYQRSSSCQSKLNHYPHLAPSFFVPVHRSENTMFWMAQGLKRRFRIQVAVPHLRMNEAALNGGRRVLLFSDQVGELVGNRLVGVALEFDPVVPSLTVIVCDRAALGRWELNFEIGNYFFTERTDAHGITQISGFLVEQLQQVDRLGLACTEMW
jgi:hypothetical protein